ncbi:MAG TPA: CHAD domain-containing protein [Euzebyales bacterium]|nr:CHAD domain-containing protein [Euzebyales bacterium]
MSRSTFQLFDDDLGDGVRRVADEELGQAIAELRGQTDASRDAEVHEARKRCKRLRALLRLVRDQVGDEVYRRENVAIRDASRRVSAVRDAQVLVSTLDDVVDDSDGAVDAAAVRDTRRALKAAHSRLRQQTLYRGSAGEQAATELEAVRSRSREWPLDGIAFDDLRPGLTRVYRRGRKRMAQAYDDPAPERFHEWRKRVKYLWHHLELLEPAWPGLISRLASETHDLSDLLGDEHDRTVLLERLGERPDLLTDPDVARALAGCIERQRERLRADAGPLGARIYAEPPDVFVDRLATYWHAGRLAA